MEVVSSLPQTSALPPRQGGFIPKRKLEERANRFAAGQWVSLLAESNEVASGATRRRRRNPSDETKALRGERMASLGELSAARQALEGAETSPARPPGGIRGIVVSDVFRRLVARTLAQKHAKVWEVVQHSRPVVDRIGRVGHLPLCGRCGGFSISFPGTQ